MGISVSDVRNAVQNTDSDMLEDFTNVTDPNERRRIQNRLAQKKYRKSLVAPCDP